MTSTYRPVILNLIQDLNLRRRAAFTLAEVFNPAGRSRKFAFTLAEVLITLGIIGVVAAMTLPTLMSNYRDKQTVVKLKKVYSLLQQAQLGIINEYGTFDNIITTSTKTGEVNEDGSDILDYSGPITLKDLFAKQMKVVKDCDSTKGYSERCLGTQIERMNGTVVSVKGYNDPTIYLADGTKIFFGWTYSPCVVGGKCAEIGVAIDRKKGSYVLGRDIFYFVVMTDRIVPKGSGNDTLSDKSKPLSATCSRKISGRENCTEWVLTYENMDYLYCDDLSWNGKHKCK